MPKPPAVFPIRSALATFSRSLPTPRHPIHSRPAAEASVGALSLVSARMRLAKAKRPGGDTARFSDSLPEPFQPRKSLPS